MKLFLDSVGCRLNQSEIEAYASQFRSVGHEIVSSPEEADLVIVNTCAVTSAAASDSRQKIRQASRAGVERIVVTGCLSSLNPEEVRSIPGVTGVVLNQEKDHLASLVLNLPEAQFDLEPVARQPVLGARLRTRAFIKAQDGCNNHCTYCITRVARGPAHSRPIQAVIKDVQAAVDSGAQEIVLTGVHLGSWGVDLEGEHHLSGLVKAVLDQVDLSRLRLSSVEPWDLDRPFFRLWQDPRLCRQLHLPLQSGAENTLRRMARNVNPDGYARLIEEARAEIPEVAITTDIIVGFPGETAADFVESLDFVSAMDFSGGHVFTYSARPGTPAAKYPDQIPSKESKIRSQQMRAVISASAKRYHEKFIGATLQVLWEASRGVGPEGWHMSGLTDNYLRVSALSTRDMWNRLTRVRIVSIATDGVNGEIVEGGGQDVGAEAVSTGES